MCSFADFRKIIFISFLFAVGTTCIFASPKDEQDHIKSVSIVDDCFQDGQGLFYQIAGKVAVVTTDRLEREYRHLSKKVTIPAKIKHGNDIWPVAAVDMSAFQFCTAVDSFYVSRKNKYLSARDGILYNKDFTQLIKYPRIRKGTDFTVPASVKKIGALAFWGNGDLRSVDLSNSVIEIGMAAFRDCQKLSELKNVQSVEKLDTACLAYTAINRLLLPAVQSVYCRAFLGCDYLQEIRLGAAVKVLSEDCLFIESSSEGCIENLKSYYIEAVEPPVITDGYTRITDGYCEHYRREYEPVLYVPAESVRAYKAILDFYFPDIEGIPGSSASW